MEHGGNLPPGALTSRISFIDSKYGHVDGYDTKLLKRKLESDYQNEAPTKKNKESAQKMLQGRFNIVHPLGKPVKCALCQ